MTRQHQRRRIIIRGNLYALGVFLGYIAILGIADSITRF